MHYLFSILFHPILIVLTRWLVEKGKKKNACWDWWGMRRRAASVLCPSLFICRRFIFLLYPSSCHLQIMLGYVNSVVSVPCMIWRHEERHIGPIHFNHHLFSLVSASFQYSWSGERGLHLGLSNEVLHVMFLFQSHPNIFQIMDG